VTSPAKRVSRVLLCDADGNLFPSEEPAFEASVDVLRATLASVGVDISLDADQLRRETTGQNFRTTASRIARNHGTEVPPAALERWVLAERETVSRHLAQVLRTDADVVGPLTRLSSSWCLAAVSSSALTRLDACFAATGLSELIPGDRRFSAEDSLPAPTSKPDPAVYLHACERLGVDPSAAWAVEDSVPGVQSAVAAGIPTLGNVQFVPAAERDARVCQLDATGAVGVVSSWAEVEELLKVRTATVQASAC
jgi:beta-phosphoglucomutase-like phosphatase (HAD superfamily)